MTLLGGALSLVISGMTMIGSAVVARLVADEAKDWAPKITGILLDRAARRLPEPHRKRYREEWASHVADVPGLLAKIVVAANLRFVSTRELREWALRQQELDEVRQAAALADAFAALDQKASETIGWQVTWGREDYLAAGWAIVKNDVAEQRRLHVGRSAFTKK